MLLNFDIYLFVFIITLFYCSHVLDTLSEYWDIGLPTSNCQHCGAIMWYEERLQKAYNVSVPKFSMCCSHGRVSLFGYSEPPEILSQLYFGSDERSRCFQTNIRSFNSMFSFTSMGGNIDRHVNNGHGPPIFIMNGENYHQIGSLLPHSGVSPKFAQLYIYDTDNEIVNRMSSIRYVFCF